MTYSSPLMTSPVMFSGRRSTSASSYAFDFFFSARVTPEVYQQPQVAP